MKKLLAFMLVLFMAGPAFGAVVSSRVMPTNPEVKTFGGAGKGRDYTSLATWEAATRGDITGEGTPSPVLECYADTVPFEITANITLQNDAAHTSTTKFRVVKAASGHENRFRKDAGVIFRGDAGVANAIFYTTTEKYFALYDVGLMYKTQNNTTNRTGVWNAGGYARVVGCYAFDFANSSSGIFAGFWSPGGNAAIINCVSDNIKGNGISFSSVGGDVAYNCTVVDCTGYGYFANRNATAINCIAEGNGTNWEQAADWSKTTCTDDGGVVFDTDGISLDSTDTVAIDQGTDLKTAGTVTWNDDGMGYERGDSAYTGAAWDIGALEYATGAVKATLIPAGAIAAGAQWRVDGGAWQDSEAVVGIAAGTYTVDYKDASGYTTPASVSAVVVDTATTEKTGEYIPAASGGGSARRLLLNLF